MLAEMFNLFFWGAFFSGAIGLSAWFMGAVTPAGSNEEKEKIRKLTQFLVRICSIIFLISTAVGLSILLIGMNHGI